MDPASTDSISLKEVFLWFAGGVAAISSTIATTMVGRIWRQHNTMWSWYTTSVDPEKEKLKADKEMAKQASLEKYHKDVADIKHEFSNLRMQVTPILKRMNEEEKSIIELMTEIAEKLDKTEQPKKR